MTDKCGYNYYNQSFIDENPERKKTDNFVRFLLCNQKAIQQLCASFYLSRQLTQNTGYSQGLEYCYRYFNIFKYLPDPCGACKVCDDIPDSKVYNSVTLFLYWMIGQKMNQDFVYYQQVLNTMETEVFNPFTKEYEVLKLDKLDLQVILLYKMMKQIEELYFQWKLCFNYLTNGKFFCYLVNFTHDLSGCPLRPLKYDGRALRELVITYSDTMANNTSPNGKPCLLNRCSDKEGK